VLLAVDIGNTSAKFGVFDGHDLISKFVIPTKRDYAIDEIADAIGGRISDSVTDAIVSSVVPEIDGIFSAFLTGRLGMTTRFVQTSDDFGLRFDFHTDTTGTDRLVNSAAAAEKFGVPVAVIAFGTATTIDAVDAERRHRGGLIAPGPATTAKALRIATAKLPEVEIAEPTNVLATNTIDAIRSGIFYSQVGLIESAVRHIKAEIGDAKVVATGGFAPLIAAKCKEVDAVDVDLTLEGLRMLHDRWQR
jgi:type III pantothenate kinase